MGGQRHIRDARLDDGTTIGNVATWVRRPTSNAPFIARGLARSPRRAYAANKIAAWLGSAGPRFSASKFMICMALSTEVERLNAPREA